MNKTKKFKPTISQIIDLPYMIHGKKVKVVKLKLNDDDDNDIDNIELLLNKFLKNIQIKAKGVKSYQIQVKFSSGKGYSVNSFDDITKEFEMKTFDTMYENIGEKKNAKANKNKFFSAHAILISLMN